MNEASNCSVQLYDMIRIVKLKIRVCSIEHNAVIDQKAKDLKELDLYQDKLPVDLALGLQWCVESDSFRSKMELKQQSLTRCGMLSLTS